MARRRARRVIGRGVVVGFEPQSSLSDDFSTVLRTGESLAPSV